MTVNCVWLQAETIGEHVHVKLFTGEQRGQDEVPVYGHAPGVCNSPGLSGTLIMRTEHWTPFIRALARGGHDTGLRVIWRESTDGRYLWNGQRWNPCIMGDERPQPWVRPE